MKYSIRLGISRLKATDLLAKGRRLVTDMTDNANFATPVPALADITTALDTFETRIKAAAYGDKRLITRRNDAQAVVEDMLRQLGSYVSMTADGSREIIESSGFDVRRKPEDPTRLDVPVDFLATNSSKEGEMELKWKGVRYGKAYQIEMSAGDPDTGDAHWTTALVTSKASGTVKNLTPGVKYWFRVKAINGDLNSGYSDVSIARAI
jgi:hypothetical protein